MASRPAPLTPDFGVDDDVAALDFSGCQQRDQRQRRRGGIAAGIGHQPRGLDRGTRQLGEAIHRLFLQVRRLVLMAEPLGIAGDVGQPEIVRQVNHLQFPGQLGDDLLGRAMGQRAEHHIDARPVRLIDLDQRRQLQMAEMGKHLRQGLAGLAVGGQQTDLHLRMAGQQAHQLSARVAARSQDSDPNSVRTRHLQDFLRGRAGRPGAQ